MPGIHAFFSRSPTRPPQLQLCSPPVSPQQDQHHHHQQRHAFCPPTNTHRSYGALLAPHFRRAPLAGRGLGGRDSAADIDSETPDELESSISGASGGAAQQGGIGEGWPGGRGSCVGAAVCSVAAPASVPASAGSNIVDCILGRRCVYVYTVIPPRMFYWLSAEFN